MPLLALPFPGHRPGADRDRPVRAPLVRARLYRRHLPRLVVRQAPGRQPAPLGSGRLADEARRHRRLRRLVRRSASSSAAASATCCSTTCRVFAANPLEIFALWHGGMSFHGGFLGTILAMVLFARVRKIPIWSLIDVIAPSVTFGLFLGRLANFINGELYGRVTDVPWAMVFPDGRPRAAPSEPALRGGARRRRCCSSSCASSPTATTSSPRRASSPAPSPPATASRAPSSSSSASPTSRSATSPAA